MKIKIDLNGIKSIDIENGTTALDILNSLNTQENKRPLAAIFNDSLIDLSLPIENGGVLHPLTFGDEEGRMVYWHSTSHIMAQAVQRLFPDVKLAIGPAISDGFYYDFFSEKPFSLEDLKNIEKEMKRIIKDDQSF